MNKAIFTRKTLYDKLWSTPISRFLNDYALTNVQLIKICKNYNIPIPEQGHWSKVKHKKPVRIKPLPDNFKGEDKIELNLIDKNTKIQFKSPLHKLKYVIESDKAAPLKVSKRLSNTDCITKNTIEFIELQRIKGRYCSFDKLVLPISYEIIDKDRALKIMDALVKLLQYRGHSIEANINKYPRIKIKGIEIEFYLREKTKRIPSIDKWSTSNYIPTGKLVLQIGRFTRKKEFTDGKILLENQLSSICAFLELYAEKEIIKNEEIQIYHLRREAELKLKMELEAKRELERTKFNELIENSNRFEQCIKIRNYINSVEKKAMKENNLNVELKNWIFWARNKADWYDPLLNRF